mgnify:CR=1 FL=1
MDKSEKIITIEYLIAHKNSLWTAIIVLCGGLAGILLTSNYSLNILSIETIVRIFLFLLGALLLPLMIVGVINTNFAIKKILK